MTKLHKNACDEYNCLSRRTFVSMSAAAVAATTAPAWLPRVAMAKDFDSSRDVLVSIYLRGGIDGLNAVVPFGDPGYYNLRPVIGVPPPDSQQQQRAIDLDGFFGVPPAMQPLMEAYQAGHLLPIHACGVMGGWSRSHFDAQRWMEVASPGNSSLGTGWLGRHLATVPPLDPDAPLRGVSMTYGMVRTMNGGPHSLAVPDPDNYTLAKGYTNEAELRDWMFDAYAREDDPLKAAAQNTQATLDLLDSIDFENYVPAGGAVYPTSSFGRALKSAAALIRANVGVEAIHIDKDGWDTHAQQGTIGGDMGNLLDDFATALAAFHKDLFTANRSDFSLVALSEFGRTARENESQGTDHGTATSVFVMGGAVAGNRVLSQWPGLAPGQLYDGVDLAPTIDYRDVLGEMLMERGGATSLTGIFPGYTPTFRGVFA